MRSSISMPAMSGAGTEAAAAARFLRAVTGSLRSAGGNNGRNGSSSGSMFMPMPVILTVMTSGVIRHPSGIPPIHAPIGAYPRVMEALVERLSQLDSHAEGAIRVVMFYDTLMQRRVDLPALARASAGLAECVAGIRLHGTGQAIRVSPDGRQASPPPAPVCATVPVTLDEEEIGTVWLERPGPPGRLDELLLDRLAIAAAAVVERYGPARTTMADPALVELVIDSGSDEAARARALRLLGFPPACRSASSPSGRNFRSTRSAA